MLEILEQTVVDFKIPKAYRSGFKTTIFLGCAPKTKIDGTER
jgi:hypothetical protein